MKKLINPTVITNFIIVFLIVGVSIVGFLPEKTAFVSSDNDIKAIYNGNRDKKQVSLMFNVYENTQVVNAIIDELNSRNLKATFFVGGCWADDNGETLVKMAESGHEIANHGYFHKDHKKLNYQKNYEEIKLSSAIVKALSGVETTLFAPPSGSFSQDTLVASFNLGHKLIMWSKDTIDWRDKDKNKIFDRATKGITNGDLVLMHPKTHSLEVLPRILDYYDSLGLQQVTVSQNLL